MFIRPLIKPEGKRIFFLLLLVAVPFVVYAERLPIKIYTVADGLAHNHITSIYQDAKGYIWFSTWEGLSRFDGYRFINYGTNDGLGHLIINDVTEDRQGRLWVATNGGGVARLIDEPRGIPTRSRPDDALTTRAKFVSFPVGDAPGANRVNEMLFDSQNNLWCLTDYGLYRAAVADANLKFEGVVVRESGDSNAMLEDGRGRLWFGIKNELVEVRGAQVIKHGPVGGATRVELIIGIIEDHQGRLLVAGNLGLFEFLPPTDAERAGQWRELPLKLKKTQYRYITVMLENAAGAVWIASDGLLKYRDGKLSRYTTAQGLSMNNIRSLAEDRDGNLWIGTWGGGVCKLAGEMIVSYTRAEGLPQPFAVGVFEDRAGHIRTTSGMESLVEIVADKVSISRQLDYPPISSQSFLVKQTEKGVWWWAMPKWDSLWIRIRKPSLRLLGGREINIADLFPTVLPAIVHFYEDENGKLWFSKDDGVIYRTDTMRSGPLVFESFPVDFPLVTGGGPFMISDRAGGLWLGNRGHLGRLWRGKFIRLQPTEGLPETDPRSLFIDSRGWLWIGMRFKGISLVKEPGAEHPYFINYSTAQGLSSDAVWAITEDDFGRLYFGTGKGLDQFDPNTNRWRHYTSKDGLAGDGVNSLHKDRHGNIWVATQHGLSRLNPRAERTINRPAPIYLSRVQVAGDDLPLAETGASAIPQIELAASRNNLTIEYVALQFQGEDDLTYQYQLEGVDQDWSAPSTTRSVTYARLAPGAYRFVVRAINQEGVASAAPASFQFRILRPFYQRWWFLSLAVMLFATVIYSIYRYRLARFVELERVRTRIAADLHDDIGSSLSRMAILSEVVKRQIRVNHEEPDHKLTEIAETARGLVDTMSDIVWSIDPRRDDLGNLILRVRQFASDVFEAKGIRWDFQTPAEPERVKLNPEQRRQVFLIFKEGINNIVRHADCASATLSLTIANNQLIAEICDDGRGCVADLQAIPTNGRGGHGLENMHARAAELGGQFDIRARPGQGTHLVLTIPL